MTPKGFLFDLDGTLLDSAPGITAALNALRKHHQLPALSTDEVRPCITDGARVILEKASPELLSMENFSKLLNRFLDFYHKMITNHLDLFWGIESTLTFLNNNNIPWGIVTNKSTVLTQQHLSHSALLNSAQVVVCGDTLESSKPNPEPIRFAAKQLKLNPEQCIYIGDALTDMQACYGCNMPGWVACYGYVKSEEDPSQWPHEKLISISSALHPMIRSALNHP